MASLPEHRLLVGRLVGVQLRKVVVRVAAAVLELEREKEK